MSKRTGPDSGKTRTEIMRAAEQEFAEKGYRGASLKAISGKIGMTTGAVYFFFSNKDDLFGNVIRQVTEPFLELMNRHYEEEKKLLRADPESKRMEDINFAAGMLESYYRNSTVWKIITENPGHEAVKKYSDGFVAMSADHYMDMIEEAGKYAGRKLSADRFDVEQFVHMQLQTIMSLPSGNFGREEMARHMRTTVKMLRGAFHAMIEE